MDLARLMGKARWRKGYRYTVSAIALDICNKPALSFNLLKAEESIPMRKLAYEPRTDSYISWEHIGKA